MFSQEHAECGEGSASPLGGTKLSSCEAAAYISVRGSDPLGDAAWCMEAHGKGYIRSD